LQRRLSYGRDLQGSDLGLASGGLTALIIQSAQWGSQSGVTVKPFGRLHNRSVDLGGLPSGGGCRLWGDTTWPSSKARVRFCGEAKSTKTTARDDGSSRTDPWPVSTLGTWRAYLVKRKHLAEAVLARWEPSLVAWLVGTR